MMRCEAISFASLRRVASLVVLFLSSSGSATAKHPIVQVEFHISDGIYRTELGTEVVRAEQAFLLIFLEELRQRIGFLDFTADPQPNRIVIQLGDPTRNPNSPVASVLFHLYVSTPHGKSSPVSWIFRDQNESLRRLSEKVAPLEKIRDVNLIGGPKGNGSSRGELATRFANLSTVRLVENPLSMIPVANEGDLVEKTPVPRWKLPLRRGENCMTLKSRFRIEHLIKLSDNSAEQLALEAEASGPPDSVPEAMTAPISARSSDPNNTAGFQRLNEPGVQSIKVLAVYFIMYERGCPTSIPPGESGLPGGGGS
jgi:hypothetical protein